MRGPEELHNELQHKQFGIVAVLGGRLKHGHFEMIRMTIGRKLPDKAFAVYRVPAPWQPISKKVNDKENAKNFFVNKTFKTYQ